MGQNAMPSVPDQSVPNQQTSPVEGTTPAEESSPAEGLSPGEEASPAQESSPGQQTAPGAVAPERKFGFIPFARANPVRGVCPRPSRPGEVECLALLRTDLSSAALPDGGPAFGFSPKELQSAYGTPSATAGRGQVVAIVDAFGYKRAASDLAAYRAHFKLPPCTASNGCLRIVNGHGGSALPAPNDQGWDYEQALDLDMVSAMCPNCKILLLQVSNTDNTTLYAANTVAARMGADVVSNSYGGGEYQSAASSYFPSGHAYVASAGDNGGGSRGGGGPSQPCSFANFVCAGGTQLDASGGARGWTETVWNDEKLDYCGNGYSQPCGATGSGCSRYVVKPHWQHDGRCAMRSESDVATVAAISTPVAAYHDGQWLQFGGTSVSSPLIAGMIALAGNARSTNIPQLIWSHGGTADFNDVISGTNVYRPVTGPCTSNIAYVCTAQRGYDGPTGWGSPHGLGAL